MSRRHHGNRPHRSTGLNGPADLPRSGTDAPAAADLGERTDRPAPAPGLSDARAAFDGPRADLAIEPVASREVAPSQIVERPRPAPQGAPPPRPNEHQRPTDDSRRPPDGANGTTSAIGATGATGAGGAIGANGMRGPEPASCTAPQLRRFIKSRPYVPMHELRRRFGINGSEDDVSSIDLGDHHHIYVGLPPREGSLLGELLRGGDIGYELSLDPRTPIVIGLYPMRPVARS